MLVCVSVVRERRVGTEGVWCLPWCFMTSGITITHMRGRALPYPP